MWTIYHSDMRNEIVQTEIECLRYIQFNEQSTPEAWRISLHTYLIPLMFKIGSIAVEDAPVLHAINGAKDFWEICKAQLNKQFIPSFSKWEEHFHADQWVNTANVTFLCPQARECYYRSVLPQIWRMTMGVEHCDMDDHWKQSIWSIPNQHFVRKQISRWWRRNRTLYSYIVAELFMLSTLIFFCPKS